MLQITKIRKEKKMSLRELARRTQLAPSYLSYLERGICKNPGVNTLSKIAKQLDVSLETLLNDAVKEICLNE